jgi:hypothetical protein
VGTGKLTRRLFERADLVCYSSLMPNLNRISLDQNWTCQYLENDPDLFEFLADDTPVPSLRSWVRNGRFTEGWGAWLHRGFSLEPMDEICLSYFLHIDSAPYKTRIYINEKHIATYSTPVKIDVTDYVWLEDNIIGIRVDCDTPGSFSEVYLQPVPCDQL